MPDRFEIQVPGRTRHLGIVRQFFETLVEEHEEIRFARSEVHEIQLVLQEACVNVIRHSAGEGPLEPIRVSFTFDRDGMVLEVHDHGGGYDPDTIPEPQPEALQEGGYGVFIMKQAMDRVETRRDENGFVLRLTRFYGTVTATGVGEEMSTSARALVGIRDLVGKESLRDFLEDTARFYGSRFLVLGPELEVVARANDDDDVLDAGALPLRYEAGNVMIEGGIVREVEVYGHTIGFLFAEPIRPEDEGAAIALCRHVSGILSEMGVKEYELNDLSQEILDSYEEVNLFYRISSAMGSARNVDAICSVILENVCEIIPVNRASILLADEKAGELIVSAAVGIPEEEQRRIRIPIGHGISGQVMKSRTARLVDDVAKLPHGMLSGYENYASRSFISVPLLVEQGQAPSGAMNLSDGTVIGPEGKAIGVINMTDKEPAESFTSGDLKLLTALAHQAATLIENTRLIELEKELRIARHIQQGLLPESPPKVPGIELAGTCEPAKNVGGDYFDYFWRKNDANLGMVIADVSGHNVASALMMAVARSALRGEFRASGNPGSVLQKVNSVLFEDLSRAELFLSIQCMVYEPVGRSLRYASAGHNPALLFRPGEDSCRILDADGLVVGVLDGMTYPDQEIVLRTGDVLLLYTDGLVEAADRTGEMFGMARLADVFGRANGDSAKQILDRVFEAVYRFRGDRFGADDMTMVVLKVVG